MKFIVLIILALLVCSFSYAQAKADKRLEQIVVSLDYKDAALWEIFKDLSKQSSINFVLDRSIEDKKITIYFNKVTLVEALNAIASSSGLKYERIDENSYLLTK